MTAREAFDANAKTNPNSNNASGIQSTGTLRDLLTSGLTILTDKVTKQAIRQGAYGKYLIVAGNNVTEIYAVSKSIDVDADLEDLFDLPIYRGVSTIGEGAGKDFRVIGKAAGNGTALDMTACLALFAAKKAIVPSELVTA